MNLREINPYEERAMDIVVNVINVAKEHLGMRQSLEELAHTAAYAWARNRVSLKAIEPPVTITAEKFIADTIENVWKLTEVFMYHLNYLQGSKDKISQYYYYEAIFSQPTASYPIPQATVSVYFRLQDKHIEQTEQGMPSMCFRIEGHYTEHDVRFVALSADWLLALMKMKIKFYKRIEAMGLF